MRQLQLFTTTQLAGMRNRTLSRRYSPAGEEFRREHERHRAWGLARRHAERLCGGGRGSRAAGTCGSSREDQAPMDGAPSALSGDKPAGRGPSPCRREDVARPAPPGRRPGGCRSAGPARETSGKIHLQAAGPAKHPAQAEPLGEAQTRPTRKRHNRPTDKPQFRRADKPQFRRADKAHAGPASRNTRQARPSRFIPARNVNHDPQTNSSQSWPPELTALRGPGVLPRTGTASSPRGPPALSECFEGLPDGVSAMISACCAMAGRWVVDVSIPRT